MMVVKYLSISPVGEYLANNTNLAKNFQGRIQTFNYHHFFNKNYQKTEECEIYDQYGDPVVCDESEVSSGGGTSGGGGSGDSGSTGGSGSGSGGTSSGGGGMWSLYCTCKGHHYAKVGSGECSCQSFVLVDVSPNKMSKVSCQDCPDADFSSIGTALPKQVTILNNNLDYELTEEQVIFLAEEVSSSDLYNINIWLRDMNHSDEAKTFILYGVEALRNGGEMDLENRLIYDPIIADRIKSRMSNSEATLFDSLSTYQKFMYLRSATEAYFFAEAFFQRPVRNRKGDAVKHSLWNALSTNYIGSSLTKQLTDAHEDIPYDYSNHYKETDMDLHNNSIGRNLSNTYYGSPIFELVIEALENGSLRYLSNLNWSGSVWLATNSSQLIPTNQ